MFLKINKKNKVIGYITVSVITLGVVYGASRVIGYTDHEREDIEQDLYEEDKTVDYKTTEFAEIAINRLSKEKELAQLKASSGVSQKKVALVFTGLAMPEQMEEIIKLLDEYEASAVFCVDGMSAAEDTETIERIKNAGYEIGNYGLEGEKYLEQYSEEEVATSIAYTQAILEGITGDKAKRFIGQATTYTNEVLHAAYCADIEEAIKPEFFINDTSFTNFSAAMGCVQKFKPGEIICVKLQGQLDEIEYEKPIEVEVSHEDNNSFLHEQGNEKKEEKDIVLTVKYLLEALRTTQMPVVSLDELDIEWDEKLEHLFATSEDITAYEVAKCESRGKAYFENALFIGDSLSVSLKQNSYPKGFKDTSDICAQIGVTAKQIVDNMTVEDDRGNKVGLWDEIIAHSPTKIYMLLGSNSLGIQTDEELLRDYERLMDKLKSQFPSVPIFIMGLTPVTESTSAGNVALTNGRIRNLNLSLAKLASSKGFYYIDLFTALADENGNLPYGLAQEDGIHLKERGVERWVSYLATHIPKEVQ